MRKFLVAVSLLLGVIYIFTRVGEMQAVAATYRNGNLVFIVLAFVVQAVWLVNVAGSYRAIYRMLGMEEKIEHLMTLAAAANFVNIVAPSGGMGGMAVFISDARQRGVSAARVTVANVLFVFFEYAGFLCVLTLGLLILFRRDNLNSPELFASGILFFVASVLATLIYLGMRSAKSLEHALTWMARTVNRLLRPMLHRDYLSLTRAHEFAFDAAGGLRELRKSPENLLTPLILAISSKALLIFVLFLMFLAFGVPFTAGTLIAGFSIGYLFLIVSPTPAGLGVVEGMLTLALTSLGVPFGAAAILTLAYRGVTFWIPLLVGLLAFRWLSRPARVNSSAS